MGTGASSEKLPKPETRRYLRQPSLDHLDGLSGRRSDLRHLRPLRARAQLRAGPG